jgi:hypothetical protein
MIHPTMSAFIKAIRDEDAKATTEARQEQLRKNTTKRKAKYILNDTEIISILKIYNRFDSDKDIITFLSRISNHLQEFQTRLPNCLESNNS